MKTYVSKIDWWIAILIFIVAPAISIFSIYQSLDTTDSSILYINLVILLCWGAVVFGVIWPLKYQLTEQALIIKTGLIRLTYSYEDFISLSHSNHPLSAPALSLKRLKIERRSKMMILISPKDREGFIHELSQRAPHVKLL